MAVMKLTDAPGKDPEEPWSRQYRKPERSPEPEPDPQLAAILAKLVELTNAVKDIRTALR